MVQSIQSLRAPCGPYRSGVVGCKGLFVAVSRWLSRSFSSSRFDARSVAILVLAATFAAAGSGCASVLRESVGAPRSGEPVDPPWWLDRELLTPANERIVFVVELVEGHPPERAALDGLVALA